MDDVSAAVEHVTPELAKGLLARLRATTRPDGRAIETYAEAMRAGAWVLNGAPIVVSADSRLLDGRLRLLACVSSGTPFDSLVVRGVQEAAFETLDAVRKRTLSDILAIREETHGRALAAALRIIWMIQHGGRPGGGRNPSPLLLLEVLQEHPEIRDSIMPALRSAPLLPHGCGIALHYLASRIDPDKADAFLAALGGPPSRSGNAPTDQLRRALEELRALGGNRKQSYVLAIAIKSMNAFLSNAPLKLLRYAPEREAFPQFVKAPAWGPLGDYARAPLIASPRPDPIALRASMVTITPKRATELLARGGRNRKLSAPVIAKYARDMAAGRWLLNGHTIKLTADGRLLDGQHRLEACRRSGKPFNVILVKGLHENVLSSLDIGRRRSMADLLREQGEVNTMALAAALRWFWIIKNDFVQSANVSPTHSEMISLLEQHPELRDGVKAGMRTRHVMGGGLAAALHTLYTNVDAEAGEKFFDALTYGQNLSGDNPAYVLRERLMRTRSSHRVRLAEAEKIALAHKAWKAFRADKKLNQLSWRNRGVGRELMPAPSD